MNYYHNIISITIMEVSLPLQVFFLEELDVNMDMNV